MGQGLEPVVAHDTASMIVASSIEKYWPMQARGPAPNGKYAWRWRGASASGAKRSGSKRSGHSQNAGWRWVTHGLDDHVAPWGTA